MLLAAPVFGPGAPAFAGPPPSSASKADYAKAQAMFDKAKRLYEAGKLQAALDGFRASYEVVASPITRLFEGRALEGLGREVDAYSAYASAIAEATAEGQKDKRYQETKDAAEQERADLARKVGLVVADVRNAPEGATLKIVEKTIPPARWREGWPVAPGSAKVTLEGPDGRHAEATVQVAAGQSVTVPIELRAAETPAVASAPAAPPAEAPGSSRPALRTGAYVAAGVGVAGLATFAIAGTMARSRFKDLQSSCGGPCPPDRQSEVDGGRTMSTVANVGLGVGIVGVSAGAVLFLLSRDGDETPAAPAATLTGGPGWLGVAGRF